MRSIAELQKKQRAIGELGGTTGDYVTITSTTGIADMQPTKWAASVVKFAEAMRYLDQVVYVNKEMIGTKDEKITIPVSTTHLDIDVAVSDTEYTEGVTRDFTVMDNMDTVDFTIAQGDWKKGAIAISKEIFMTCAVDMLSQARYSIAQDMADDVDLALADALQSTSVTNVVWGGDATQVEDLAAGDVLTTDLIADAERYVELNNFVPKYLVISPYQKATLLKDSQFVNASEYGSNEVVMKGEIGTYLGLKVLITTNTNMASTTGDTDTNEAASPGASMNCCLMVGDKRNGEKCSVGLAWKETPKLDYEYEKNEARHVIYYDQCFTTSLIFKEAICLIKVTQT